MQAAMSSVVRQRFPHIPLPEPLRPKPIGNQRPFYQPAAGNESGGLAAAGRTPNPLIPEPSLSADVRAAAASAGTRSGHESVPLEKRAVNPSTTPQGIDLAVSFITDSLL